MSEPRTVQTEIAPRWKLVERVIEERVLADDFDAELAPLVATFADDAEAAGLPRPEERQVIDRIRHILRHVGGDGNQKVVLLSNSRAPYFGVTTKLADTVEVREPRR